MVRCGHSQTGSITFSTTPRPGVMPSSSSRAKATKMAARVGADPVDGLDSPVAHVVDQPGGDLALEHAHLPVEDLDQIPQGLDLDRVGVGQGRLVEELAPAGPRNSPGGSTPSLANTEWIWALSPLRTATSLAR
jgi:hypothetical protein